jgi:hypothetical protein
MYSGLHGCDTVSLGEAATHVSKESDAFFFFFNGEAVQKELLDHFFSWR